MAALYLRQGQTVRLKALAEEMSGLLEGPGLSREGAVSLKLFCRLAAQEKMSLERAFHQGFLPPSTAGDRERSR